MSKRQWREAEELAERGRWDEAGARWAELAERALRVRDTAAVRAAAVRAADAFRRDDRPAASARMLGLAWNAGADGADDAAQLAAALLDAGQVDAAAEIAARALAGATEPVPRTLALDTLVGLRLVQGRIEDARAALDALAAIGLPGADIARRFRAAQLDRVDGLVAAAEQAWAALAEELAPHPQAAGPVGATHAELGEIALLRAAFAPDPGPLLAAAIARFQRAGTYWARAGRRAGAFRAEAWTARARALAGETVLPATIDRAIAYAETRGMPMLAAELLVCRAVVARDAAPVDAAIALLAEAPLARGRARVVRAELLGGGADAADLERALAELAGDGPWAARALRALGSVRGDARLLEEAAARAASWGSPPV